MLNEASAPRIAYLLPTGRCNLSCAGCYATLESWGRHTRKGELDLERYREVIAELVGMGVRVFDICGGEPFLYPQLEDLCRAVRAHPGTEVWLVTNGTRTSPAKLERLVECVDRFVVSLDASTPAEHDALRGRRGAFHAALGTVRAALRAGFPEVCVNQLVQSQNRGSVAAMLELCRAEGVHRLALLSYRDVSENASTPEAIPLLTSQRALWDEVAAFLGQYGAPARVDIVAPAFLHPETSAFKRSLSPSVRSRITLHHPHLRGLSPFRDTLVVKPLGTLTGDTAMINDDLFEIGTVWGGTRAVWAEGARAWRETLEARQQALRAAGPCATCSRWNVCRGGCPAAAKRQSGSIAHHDSSCDAFRSAGCF